MTLLRLGMRSGEVVAAQRMINDYFARERVGITIAELAIAQAARPRVVDVVASGYRIAEDGDYGEKTDAAVYLIQVNEDGLSRDGAIGPMTLARLERRVVEPVEVEDATKNGVAIDGVVYSIPGHRVVGPHDAAWAHLAPGDCRKRPRNPDGSLVHWIRQWIYHKTIADDPEVLLQGKGPTGLGRRTAEYWQGDGVYGGAQVIFADDGEVDALCDLYDVEAFHATASNRWSVGSELREVGPRRGEAGGRFYSAALDAATATIAVCAPKLGIQLQSHRGPYTGHPIKRMQAFDGKVDFGPTPGGPDMCGIFGHRDNTERRGKWDPGELWLSELRRTIPGFELFDFAKGEDLVAWRDRQSDLARAGHRLAVNGVPGPETVAALKLEGFIDGIWALGKAA